MAKRGRLSAFERGMFAGQKFKKFGQRIKRKSDKPISLFGVKRNVPREQRRQIAKNVRDAKAGELLSSRKLNDQFLRGFFENWR